MQPKRVAIVADWLTSRGGAERVIAALLEAFPRAKIFTTVYNPAVFPEYKGRVAATSLLQKIPFLNRRHQLLLPLLPIAVGSLNLSGFDLIISSSSAVGKGIKKPTGAVHICYCHTPMRYVWQTKTDRRLIRLPLGRLLINWLKKWDLKTNQGVDYFIANSRYTAARITKNYHRHSTVIYPPVEPSHKPAPSEKEDFYFAVSRLTPYKRFDLAVLACRKLGRKLLIAGEGPELGKLKEIAAGKETEFLGRISDKEKIKYLQAARAVIFPAEEDFGIVPIEAMACGTPVVAFGRGGARETVRDGQTGVLFIKQNVAELVRAIKRLDKISFQRERLTSQARRFSKAQFIRKIKKFVEKI